VTARQLGPNSSSLSSGRSAVGMRYDSFSQLPKSTSLQRAEQKGRGSKSSGAFSSAFLQMGQLILTSEA
jgi:hypothetical protein